MEEYAKKIKAITVRIKCRDRLATGVLIINPAASDRVFVATAKHSILGDNFDDHVTCEDISIAKFKDGKKINRIKLDSDDEIIHYDNVDITVLSLHVSKFEKWDKIPPIRIAYIDDYIKTCTFRGYPRHAENKRERSGEAIYDSHNSEDNLGAFNIGSSFLKYFERREIKYAVPGLSGG